MDLHKHARGLYDFLPFYGPCIFRTQRQGIHCENQRDLFWHRHNFPPLSWGVNIKLRIDVKTFPSFLYFQIVYRQGAHMPRG